MVVHEGKFVAKIKRESFVKILLPRLEDILFLAIFLAVIGLGPRLMNMDGDLGRHLTIGNYILDNWNIPTRDIFSHTMEGLTLTPHEWLAQVIFALSYRLGGLDGVVILCALLLAITFTLVFRQCFKRSNMLLVSLGLTVISAAAASIHWLARPHLFTLLFTVLWVSVLENYRQQGNIRWWILPLLMLIWVNLHGAFIAGFVIWGIYLLDSLVSKPDKRIPREVIKANEWLGTLEVGRARKIFLIGIIVFFISFFNPVGWQIWETTLGFLQNRYLIEHTVEYLPPDFHQINAWPFLIMIFSSLFLFSLYRQRVVLAAALLITIWTVMGLLSARNISLYAVVAAPILAEVAAAILRDNKKFFGAISFDLRLRMVDANLFGYLWSVIGILLIIMIILSGASLDFDGSGNDFSSDMFPVAAADWLAEQQHLGPGFNYFPWGGYLLYRVWPQQQVFIDGQTDFYGESLTRKYEQVIMLGEGWWEILDEYQVQWVIMPSKSRLVEVLFEDHGWEQKYKDETSTILISSE